MNTQAGLSLPELLVSLGLAATMLVSGVPAYQDLRDRAQRTAATNELIATLGVARTEAILRRMPAIVCPKDADGQRCRRDGIWHHGWIAFVDGDGDGQPGSARDRLLAESGAMDGVVLHSGATRPRVRYAPSGMNTGSNLSIRLCQRNAVVSAVVINNAGRPRVERDPAALAGGRCGEG